MKLSFDYIIKAAGLVLIFSFAFGLAYIARENMFVQDVVASYGYFGILLASFVSGFNLLIPIPAISFLPLYLEAGLDFWLTLSVISIGMTAADSIAYLLGYLGRDISKKFSNKRAFETLDVWSKKYRFAHPVIMFFYASVIPLPNEVLLVPLGIMKSRFIYLFPAIILGNAVFNTLAAFGVVSVFGLLF